VTQTESTRIIQSTFILGASLIEAMDEESILRACMRAGCQVLNADGCLFLPLNEFAQNLPPLAFGRVPSFDSAHLSNPAQRQHCKVCKNRHAGTECPLLHGDAEANIIHCVPLHFRGRESGLFSFVFSSPPKIDRSVEGFLAESIRLSGIALDARDRRQLIRSSPPTEDFPELSDEVRSLLAQREARAILQERARLAREIHDGLAQTLAFLKIEIGRAESMLSHNKPDQAASILKDSSRTLGDAYLDAREAIENLRRVPDNRLDGWLKQVAEDFESISGLPVEVKIDIVWEFPVQVQAQMIRIVQEALTNVRKHAQASHVKLTARELETELLLEVADDGRGFDPTNSIAAARFGLRGMRERAESVGADFQIASCPEKGGTTVQLRVPLRIGVKP
jgi:signal transduction histidine kinase